MEVIGESVKVPLTIIRGGTSKGIFIKKEFLPSDVDYSLTCGNLMAWQAQVLK